MRIRFLKPIIAMSTVLVLAPVLVAQSGQSADEARVAPAPTRTIAGVWGRQAGDPSLSSIHSLTGVARGPGFVDFPPMTEWGQARFEANRPGYGIRQQPMGNDPRLRCMPLGVPRTIWGGGEWIELPTKVLHLMGEDSRQIATDGRPLEVDPPEFRYSSGWTGQAVGRWEDDYTFVVESAGFHDLSWLSEEGLPHSEEMGLVERYTRVDAETMILEATIDDPKTYTELYEVIPLTFKLRGDNSVIRTPSPCNPDAEKQFEELIRRKAVESPDSN